MKIKLRKIEETFPSTAMHVELDVEKVLIVKPFAGAKGQHRTLRKSNKALLHITNPLGLLLTED